jgi:hypothetical protein
MSEEEPTMATPSIMEVMQAMFNNLNNNMNNINDSLRAEINNNNSKIDQMQVLNAAARVEMFELIDQRSRRSTRASSRTTSRAVGTRQFAASLIATIPVTISPIIVPLLKAPPLSSMVIDIKSSTSTTPIEPIQFLTDITIKEIVQPFEIVIVESVRTNGSQYDITPPARPNHPFEDIPEGDNLSRDFNAANQEETSDGQPCDLILQLQYPRPIFKEDNSWGDKFKCFSGDRNATSYSVCGTLHNSITMALIT